jgi:squalene synthase HpnC
VVADAYATCLEIARRHYENFPVASALLPAPMRPHIAAIYAFARGADDIADEPGRTPDDRVLLLDAWRDQLHGAPRDAVFIALADTREKFDLPISLFDDLLSAFRQDVTTTRYKTWDGVYDYCRRSANPVGRLVLRVAGYRDDQRDQWSDAVCTALQLTNFWQDLAIDWERGRLYLPEEEWAPTGASVMDLDRRAITVPWRVAIGRAAQRTRDHFEAGRPICDAVHGRLRYELRATWLGGVRVLDRLEAVNFDVFARRPRLRRRDLLVIALDTLFTWPATPPSTTRS